VPTASAKYTIARHFVRIGQAGGECPGNARRKGPRLTHALPGLRIDYDVYEIRRWQKALSLDRNKGDIHEAWQI
jgi:hypothetical protein